MEIRYEIRTVKKRIKRIKELLKKFEGQTWPPKPEILAAYREDLAWLESRLAALTSK